MVATAASPQWHNFEHLDAGATARQGHSAGQSRTSPQDAPQATKIVTYSENLTTFWHLKPHQRATATSLSRILPAVAMLRTRAACCLFMIAVACISACYSSNTSEKAFVSMTSVYETHFSQ